MAIRDRDDMLLERSTPVPVGDYGITDTAPSAIPLQKAIFDLTSWLMTHNRDGKRIKR